MRHVTAVLVRVATYAKIRVTVAISFVHVGVVKEVVGTRRDFEVLHNKKYVDFLIYVLGVWTTSKWRWR